MLLARATGLRIGELVDLELDCVHEIPGHVAWLKVPLGKLATERMVPLDEQTVVPVDRICVHPSSGRPLPHPKTGRPTEFLLAHHGRWVSVYLLRDVLTRVTRNAGLPTPPHSCDIPTPPPSFNAGVSLQSLMALLGHVSATMSLRYGRLVDAIVEGEYERALTEANLLDTYTSFAELQTACARFTEASTRGRTGSLAIRRWRCSPSRCTDCTARDLEGVGVVNRDRTDRPNTPRAWGWMFIP